MGSNRLSVERLQVRRFPGFPMQGFQIQDLGPGINVIHGPNASGKTTIAQAIRATLWPETAPPGAETHAVFRLDGKTLTALHEGGRTTWRRDGTDIEPPGLPKGDNSDRYVLCLHELLAVDRDDDSFAHAVLEESAGGYHVPSAAEALGWTGKPRRRHNELKALREARNDLEEGLTKNRRILRDQRQLESLEQQLAAARAAQARAELLDIALDHAHAREQARDAEAALEVYPQVITRLRGDEVDRADTLSHEIQEATAKTTDAQERISEAQSTLEKTRLPEEGVEGTLLGALQEQAQQLGELDRRRHELDEALEGQQTRLEAARQSLGSEMSEEVLLRLEPRSWGDILAFADTWQKTRLELEQAEQEQNNLARPTTSQDPETVRRGVDSLRGWLRERATPKQSANGQRLPLSLTAALGALTAGAAAWLVHLAFLAPAILLLILLAWGLQTTRARSPEHTGISGSHQSWQAAYEQTRLDPPAHWDEPSVRKHLDQLESLLLEAREAARTQQRRDTLAQKIHRLQQETRELEARAKTIQKTLGPLGEDPRSLVWILDRSAKWREAHDALATTHARRDQTRKQHAQLLEQIQQTLERYGYPPESDTATIRAQIRDLEKREQQRATATTQKQQAETQHEQAEATVSRLRTTHDKIFDDLGLPPGDRNALEDLLERHQAYTQARKEADEKRNHADAFLERMRRHPHADKTLEAATPAQLLPLKEDAREHAAEAEATATKMGAIQRSIEDAKQDTRIQQALARHDQTRETLRDALVEDAENLIGHLVAQEVHQETRDQGLPPVFHRARRLLALFTRGRYQLELSDRDDTRFQAVDQETAETLELHELSSGTRMQLLIAVRIAFVEQQEHTTNLPVILDEILANSDDLRTRAIIEAMAALASEGRQLIYLSARSDEVVKWRDQLEKTDVPLELIDLAKARALSDPLEIPATPKETPAPLDPPPEGATHNEYASRLKVPRFDPWQDPGRLHLWYLIDEPQTLHQILQEGIRTWGQLHTWLEQEIPLEHLTDDHLIEKTKALARAAETYTQGWRTGRGRPVHRGVLEDSGAVTDTHMDTLVAIANRCGGDAEAVLEAIDRKEVKRFHKAKRDELEAYLIEQGHLETNPTLDRDEIRTRMLQSVSDELHSGAVKKNDIDELLERLDASATQPKSRPLLPASSR